MKRVCTLALIAAAAACPAWADSAADASQAVTVADGAAVYQHVCQGCHMPDGRGAVGAAAIPALAGNAKLAAPGYPVHVILHGYGAMPWFNGTLSAAQIAAVVNYVRGHFGNNFAPPVTAAFVAARTGPAPVLEQ